MKLITFVLLIIFLNQYAAAAIIDDLSLNRKPKIVGGKNADILEFPSLVSILNNGHHHCAGTLLNEYWILTASHCWLPVNQSTIAHSTTILKSNNSNFIAHSEQFIQHELFDSSQLVYDIALVKVKNPINLDIQNAYAKLPIPGNHYISGTNSVVSGWGLWDYNNFTTPPLQKADLKIWSYKDCKLAHKENPFNLTIHPHQICAGVADFSKAECNGDSGGPLIVNGVQVGIVSWSVKPCAVAKFPGVYTDVSFFIGWIQEKTEIAFF